MSEWIRIENGLPNFTDETVVHVLLKDDGLRCWLPARYDQLLEKAWWIPQRETFVVDGVEDAMYLISHWMPLPEPPK